MNIDEILNRINKILNWWLEQGHKSMDIPLLLKMRSDLSILNAYLAEPISQVATESKLARHNKQRERSEKQIQMKGDGSTVLIAESQAILDTQQLALEEIKKEGLSKQFKTIWESNRDIQNAMAGMIAYRVDEWKRTQTNKE